MTAYRQYVVPSAVIATLTVGLAWVSDARAGFSYIHETMDMGTRESSGPVVSFGDQGASQLISGTLFQIPTAMDGVVTAVGGHMAGGNQSTDIPYTAIVKLNSGAGMFPSTAGDSNPIGNATIVAANAFPPPQSSLSRDVRIPMPVTLDSGSYALLFGAGGAMDEFLFGPGGFVQPSADNVSDGTLVNGFLLQFPTDGSINDTVIRWNSFANAWSLDSSNNNIRMYVEGALVVPEPSSIALLGAGIVSVVFIRRRCALA